MRAVFRRESAIHGNDDRYVCLRVFGVHVLVSGHLPMKHLTRHKLDSKTLFCLVLQKQEDHSNLLLLMLTNALVAASSRFTSDSCNRSSPSISPAIISSAAVSSSNNNEAINFDVLSECMDLFLGNKFMSCLSFCSTQERSSIYHAFAKAVLCFMNACTSPSRSEIESTISTLESCLKMCYASRRRGSLINILSHVLSRGSSYDDYTDRECALCHTQLNLTASSTKSFLILHTFLPHFMLPCSLIVNRSLDDRCQSSVEVHTELISAETRLMMVLLELMRSELSVSAFLKRSSDHIKYCFNSFK